MKKYMIFIASFALFYGLYQIVSGLVLTAFYTPNPMMMNSALSNEVAFGNLETFPMIILSVNCNISVLLYSKGNDY